MLIEELGNTIKEKRKSLKVTQVLLAELAENVFEKFK